MKIVKITLEMLKKYGACLGAQQEFERLFGKEAEVTMENAEKALKGAYLGENAYFAVRNFLTQDGIDRWYTLVNDLEHVYDEDGHCKACREGVLKFVEVANDGGWKENAGQ